ncbi:MAG: class I adenylate-forming enzyme family protein [Desulfomonilaceae bacterium]
MHLGGLVSRNKRTVPEKEGIIYQDKRYTWSEVDDRVNTVANALIKAGVRQGDKVAMWMFNSDLFVIAFYGIVKTGAVAVPVNFRLAPPEAEYIFTNCDAVALIFDDVFEPAVREMKSRLGKIKHLVSAGPGRFEGFQPMEQVMASGDLSDPGINVDEYSESEIIYTSGTTGRPKGAVLVHHNQMVVTTTMCTLYSPKQDERILHVAPLFHSAELNLYLNPGTYMGCTHVIMKDFVPSQVLAMMEKEKITQFFGAPIMFMTLMNVPNFDEYDLSSVRYYGYGAAPMAAESVKQMIAKFKTTNFFCLCGLTEGGPGGIALYPEDQIRKAGAGGKYIVNMETKLVDDAGNTITKPGVVGELVIKGETCMKEYYNNPQATADTIRDGWVHTGDLGVRDDEGYITLVDRLKDMIITGGENVYSKEVEDALHEHQKIQSAVVIGVPHPVWGETIMAVATLRPEQKLTLEELREFLKQRLADYKVPRLLDVVEALPVNVSGKVMKYRLRDQYKAWGEKLQQ